MKKRILSALLVLALVLALAPQVLLPVQAAEYKGSCGESLKWYLDTDTGVLRISGTGEMSYSTVPWSSYTGTVKSIVVEPGATSIAKEAFSRMSKLTEVSLPEGLITIGEGAFRYDSSLTSLVIPETVQEIGNRAFSSTGLTEISIPDSVISIGNNAFSDTDLTAVKFGKGLKTIDSYAFESCKALKAANLPDSITTLGDHVFEYCSALTDVHLPAGITGIGHNMFNRCKSLVRVTVPEGVTCIGLDAFRDCPITNLVLPEGLTTIMQRAFMNTELVELVIPASVTSIDQGAFDSCDNLKRLAILNPDCWLPSYTSCLGIVGVVTVYGNKDSAVQTYAQSRGYDFEVLDGTNLWKDKNNEPIFINNPFTDVAEGRFYYNPVLWAVDKGITSGMTPTTFQPDATCTRGQVVTFLWRAVGSPEPKSGSCPFVDVAEGRYYYKAVLWAYENGITAGMDATHFMPESTVTRGQSVTFLWRTQGKPTPGSSNPFVDVKQGAFYYNAVLWAAANGVTAGMDATHFGTEQGCTRGQVVTFLYRCFA